MGSGLILLVIVAAWLAVLVPMALRSHEASSLGTVDKFHDAMRVLSRREADELALDEGEELADEQAVEQAALRSIAVRRRRILLALLALAMGTLVAALLGPRWLFGPHLVAGLAFAGYVGHLRIQARRADREALAARSSLRIERRAAEAAEVAARARELLSPTPVAPAPVARRVGRPMRIAGVPDRMPTRLALGATPRPLPVEGAELVADFAADGELAGSARPAEPAAAAVPPPAPAAPAAAAVLPAGRARPVRSDAGRSEGAGGTARSGRTRRVDSAATAAGAVAPPEEKPKRAQPPAARGAQGGAWLPVPVPPPIYLSAPPAPRRRARPKAEDEAAVAQEPSVEDVTDEQRAVND